MRLYSRRLDKPGPLRAIETGAGSPGTIILACTELVQACGLTSSLRLSIRLRSHGALEQEP